MPAEDPNDPARVEGDETLPGSAPVEGHSWLSPGTLLADRFRVLELLGTGGMGEVYLAEDARLDRQVAIKLLSDELARDSESLARFEREARTAARLNHPNVATVYDFGQSEGVSFIAMELLEGKTLRDTLLEQKSLPVVELLDIAIQIARGLAAAHQGNIVHRDLKPANVMILEDGRVKILDFGLAKAVQSETSEMDYETRAGLTGAGQVLGTVNYMSPEQVRGEPLDARSDLFSLGTVLCEMACGSVPFGRATAVDTMSAILNDSPRSARGLETEIPAQLAPLIERLLAKEPRDRFQSSRDVLADLQRLKKDAESAQRAASSKGPKSIAVLPFVNMSADPENEYFSDGLAEELINALSHLEGLHVASRTSAFRYKGQDADIRTIGRELDVDAVLEGSVRKSGKRLRITAQLIGAADGYHIWSERYDRDLEDIFEVQDEITATIVESLKIQVGAGSSAGVIKRTTGNVEAYNEYLKGRYFWYKRSRRWFHKGIECFENAITIDPDYALAHAGLADSYTMMGSYLYAPTSKVLSKARSAADRALEIDGALPEAHYSLGLSRLISGDPSGSRSAFERAIELDPNHTLASSHLGWSRAMLRLDEEALAAVRRGQELDPLSPITRSNVAYVLYLLDRFDESLAEIEKTVEIVPDHVLPHMFKGTTLLGMERYGDAALAFGQAVDLSGRSPVFLCSLGAALGASGRTTEAERILEELTSRSGDEYVAPVCAAMVHLGLGQIEEAGQMYERASRDRNFCPSHPRDPLFKEIRTDPRFQAFSRPWFG